mgnify:CR=1 FL=1
MLLDAVVLVGQAGDLRGENIGLPQLLVEAAAQDPQAGPRLRLRLVRAALPTEGLVGLDVLWGGELVQGHRVVVDGVGAQAVAAQVAQPPLAL